jgi:PKD repeat protein
MRPATITPIVLFICCCLAATVDTRGAPSKPFPAAGLERGVPRDSQQSDETLRAQSERSSPSRQRQLRVELLVEGDAPFEPNKPIQFAVLAEPWGQDLEYRYSFGDGPPTGWLGDSRFPHSYPNPGTYRVYVEVRSKQGLPAAAGPWRSGPVRVQVVQKERPISVNLETHDSPPFRVGEPLLFAARAEGAGLRLEYQFFFGDGRSSSWTREDTARHAYAAAGTYKAVVFVRKQPSEEQGGPSAAGSGRALLRVVIEPDAMKDGQQAVRLSAYPIEVHAGEAVRLEAHMEPETEDLEFIFEFGDGEQSERQSEGATAHRYKNPGTYRALVRGYKEGTAITESQPVAITVVSGMTHRLLLDANNTNPGATEPVRFTWRVEPPATGVLYHVDFGDSYGGWVSEDWAEHAYRQSGEYRALLRARIGGRDVQSNEIVVTVKENVPAWLRIVFAGTAGAAGAIVLVWRIIARARNRKLGRAVKAGAVNAAIVVRPHKDLGTRSLEFSTPASGSFEVRLQPFPDSGKQVMQQGMITHKRKGDNHG